MNQAIIVVVMLAVMVAIFYFASRKRSPNTSDQSLWPVPIPSTFAFQQLTPGGVWICSVVDVALHAMELIDEGIATQIERSRALNPDWQAGDGLDDYELIFIEPMATNRENDPGSPALLVYGIQAAGTVIGTNPGGRPIIVLPHQAATGWSHTDYLRESARNESEHVRLAMNDRDLFDHYQGANDVHPIFP